MNNGDLIDLAQRVYDGDPWYGSPILEALECVDAGLANARLNPQTHTIYEIVSHIRVWMDEVASRIAGNPIVLPPDGDWQHLPPCDELTWQETLNALHESQKRLLAALAHFPTENLEETVGEERDQPLGSGTSYRVMIHGLLLHTTYHVGQIVLLKDALGATPPV